MVCKFDLFVSFTGAEPLAPLYGDLDICREQDAKERILAHIPFVRVITLTPTRVYSSSLACLCLPHRDQSSPLSLPRLAGDHERRRPPSPRWTPPTAVQVRAAAAAQPPAPSRTSSRTTAPAATPSTAPSPTVRVPHSLSAT